MINDFDKHQRSWFKERTLRLGIIILPVALILILLLLILTDFSGIKGKVSGENYIPVIANINAKTASQEVSDGERVEQGDILFRLFNQNANLETLVKAEGAGLFYGVNANFDGVEQGQTLGFVKYNQPSNLLHLQLERGQQHLFNIGDNVILSRNEELLEGTITLLLGEREQGSGQKIGIAFAPHASTIKLLPGTEFEIILPKELSEVSQRK